MQKTIRIIIAAIGVILLVNGGILFATANIDFGIIIVTVLGAALLIITAAWKYISPLFCHKAVKVIFTVICIITLTVALFASFLFIYGNHDNVTYDEDALIVLGCGILGDRPSLPLAYRLDSAVYYFEKNPEAYIVVSGGQGYQEEITEAQAMEKYLIEHGVAAERIIKEENATSTFENFNYSKEILDNMLGDSYSVAFVTNDFHIFRAERLARLAGLNVVHCHAELPWYTIIPNYVRETAAVLKMFILKK